MTDRDRRRLWVVEAQGSHGGEWLSVTSAWKEEKEARRRCIWLIDYGWYAARPVPYVPEKENT